MPDRKIAFISATSGFTLGAAAQLIKRPQIADGARLTLFAPAEEADDLAVMAKAVEMMARGAGSGIEIEATTDRRTALDGADFVVTALRHGRLDAHRIDIELPKEYGIYEIVGDTVNPGGIFAGLRNYALIAGIAEDMKRYSRSGAWIVNMSNPESSICRMVVQGNGVPIVGLCPGIYGIKGFLARFLEVPEGDLTVELAGINHLTWVTRLEYQGRDMYPDLAAKHAQKGVAGQPVSFRLFREFGLYPSPADRHVAEFFPFFLGDDTNRGADYGLVLRDVDAMVASRQNGWLGLQERVAANNLTELYQHLGGESQGGLMIAEVIEGLTHGHGRTLQCNTANEADGRSAIEGIPAGSFVEVPATIDKAGVHPKSVGKLPLGVTGVLTRFFTQQALVAKAALEGDRQAIVQAMLLDPSLRRIEHAQEITDRMLAAHAAYLPMFA
ncbi:MAG: family 4 glycosyl hydrolase [Anaerolineae bacterium]